MQRRDFITKVAASFLVVQGIYLLPGCNPGKIDAADLGKISPALQGKFDALLKWLNQKGWTKYLLAHTGLNLDAAQDKIAEELLRKLDKLPLSEKGFDDFAGIRGIEPGLPAMSLLYHALASPRVQPEGFPETAYPSVEQLDILENYIYAVQPFNISEEELKENYMLAVFAYEYRPAFKTPHHAHADLVFSRSGVARIGECEMNYDKINRNFSNAPAADDVKKIAVTAARYGLFLAKVIDGKHADSIDEKTERKGEISLLGTDKAKTESDGSIDPGDDARYFLQPVRKIFHDDLLIDEQPIYFNEYHQAEKLKRMVVDQEYKLLVFPDATYDFEKPPFRVISETSTNNNASSALVKLTAAASSVLVSSVKNKMIREAYQGNNLLKFEVPVKNTDEDPDHDNRYFTTYNSQTYVEDIEILAGDKIKTRNPNQYNHPRNTPLYLNIRYIFNPEDKTIKHTDLKTLIFDKHWTKVFEDSICDGSVFVKTSEWKTKAFPKELLDTCLPAFSVVTAPDFFPQVDSFDLLEFDIDVQRNSGVKSNFYEGGLPSMSAGRIRPNPNTVQMPEFSNASKQELKYTYTSVLSNSAHKDFKSKDEFKNPVNREYKSSSFLPDVCSFVFAPGWDVTYCNDKPMAKDVTTRKADSYLSTRGLGSPFPEDMKLCAAVNGMWPAASPDASRTFLGSLDVVDKNPTAIPLMDMEIGIHKDSPALKGKNSLPAETFGWDGEQGPFLQQHPEEKKFVVNFTDLGRADYLENLTRPELHGFDMSLLRELSSAELVARMEALRNCIKFLPQITFKEDLNDNHIVAYTKLWLVSAEKVDDWGKGANGYGVPDDLIGTTRTMLTTAQKDISKEGYLYVFVNPLDDTDTGHINWVNKDGTGKRRWQVCQKIYVCQVTATHLSICEKLSDAPATIDFKWSHFKID